MRFAVCLALSLACPHGWGSAQRFGPSPPNYELQLGHDLDQSFFVGAVKVTRDEIRRQVLYGAGRRELRYQEDRFLVEQQLAIPSPHDRAHCLLPDSKLNAVLAEKAADFQTKYPTLNLEFEIDRAFRSRELYERWLRGDMLFEQTFLPDDPKHWPEVTIEALREEAGKILIDDSHASYARRFAELSQQLEVWDGTGKRPSLKREDSMYRSILHTIIRDYLLQQGGSNTLAVRSSPEWVSRLSSPIEGGASRLLATADLWQTIEHSVTSEELLTARRFLATVEATKQSLAREGRLLPWEEAMSRWQPSEVHADTPKWGPHREAELAYAQIYESYRAAIATELRCSPGGGLSEELQQYLEQANALMGLARVTLELLPTLAFDMDTARWKPNGWATALEKAQRIATRLQLSPGDWDKLLEEEGEYWAPPPPTRSRPCQGPLSALRNGKDRSSRTFRSLRKTLNESNYTEFLTGHSVATSVFYDGQPGLIYGPYRGNLGFYLVKVIERSPTRRPLDLNDEKHLVLLRNSYTLHALLAYARAALAAADVRGRLDH